MQTYTYSQELRQKKTCAEDSKSFFIMRSKFKNFKDNSRKTMNQNSTTIKYKILTKHSNNLASLQKQKKKQLTNHTNRSKKDLANSTTNHRQTNLVGDFPKLVSTLNQTSFCRIEVFKFQSRCSCHISHKQIRRRCQ